MKNTFLDENFLLPGKTARELFHGIAAKLPIIDYHCHINPAEIVENKSYDNLTQVWLYGDHYKWRLMRSNGTPERLITGGAGDWDKFSAYAAALPLAAGNPLLHWSHLELRRFFDVQDIVNKQNAPAIWLKVNAKLGKNGLRCRDFITRSSVEVICTTDDPTDDLSAHAGIAAQSPGFSVLPTWRPDKAFKVSSSGWKDYIAALSVCSGLDIASLTSLKDAMGKRLDFFAARGCRLSDHGLDIVPPRIAGDAEAAAIFDRALCGSPASLDEENAFTGHMLLFLGEEYAKRGWAMQLHLGAIRNNSSRMFARLGSDTGYDSMDDLPLARPLAALLDALDSRGVLPKTVLYGLNPVQNDVLGTIMGCFQGETPGKIQLGSGWWFCDQLDGIRRQLTALGELGLMGRFVGMLTDSRSFLSYPRHEYFRRIFCGLLGSWVEEGLYPDDSQALERIVRGVCYENAKAYFGV